MTLQPIDAAAELAQRPPAQTLDDPRHECPVGECSLLIPYEVLLCRRHWAKVPRDLQRKVYRAWRRGRGAGTPEHLEAMRQAIAAVEVELRVDRGLDPEAGHFHPTVTGAMTGAALALGAAPVLVGLAAAGILERLCLAIGALAVLLILVELGAGFVDGWREGWRA